MLFNTGLAVSLVPVNEYILDYLIKVNIPIYLYVDGCLALS